MIKKLSDLNEKKIKDLYLTGISGATIAKQFGVGKTTIHRILKKVGFKSKPKPEKLTDEYLRNFTDSYNNLVLKGLKPNEIVKKLKLHESSIRRRVNASEKLGYIIHSPIIRKNHDFIRKSIEVHGHAYCYEKTKYVDSETKLTITCHIHGDFQVYLVSIYGELALKE